jgi:antitoxin VapB
MSLNLKNEQTHRLIQQLARLTGESQTAAVTHAVQERLNRILRADEMKKSALASRLLEIGQDAAIRLRGPFASGDHGDLLYDEKGLPR